MRKSKACTRCGIEYIASRKYFPKHKKGKYGLEAQCKPCKNKYKLELKKRNPEYARKQKEATKANYEANRSDRLEYLKKWRIKNATYVKKTQKEYREVRKEAMKIYCREWRKRNPEKIISYKHYTPWSEKSERQKKTIYNSRKKACDNLTDWYVRANIRKKYGSDFDIPNDMIAVERQLLLLNRKIKQHGIKQS